jgi:hypothetical protein
VDTTQTIPQRLRAFSMYFRRVFRIRVAMIDLFLRPQKRVVPATA